jgi:hypothetical protein
MRRKYPSAGFVAAVLVGAMSVAALAQSSPTTPSKANAPKPDTTARITIEVSGGEKDAPVENASVYLKYVEVHLIKDKKFELNVKTNHEGTAHVPEAPMGKVLVQVVAEGWKLYGKWCEVTEAKQTIKVHLDRPPKWY